METKRPENPRCDSNRNFMVFFGHFCDFFVNVPVTKNNAEQGVNGLFHHWVAKFGPSQYLILL